MNDFENFCSLLTKVGLKYEIKIDKKYASKQHPDAVKYIEIDEGVGYSGFVCYFYFDADGKFLCHGLWE